MYWNKAGAFKFQVNLRPNQKLKFSNPDSAHRPPTFQAIPVGVTNRLNQLTLTSSTLQNITIDKTYPNGVKVFQIAGIALKHLLIL